MGFVSSIDKHTIDFHEFAITTIFICTYWKLHTNDKADFEVGVSGPGWNVV